MPTTAQMIEALVAMRHDPGGVPPDHFWQIVERFRADLVNQAFALLGNQDDAEDVAQVSLAKAFRLLHTLKEPEKLGIWMRQINRRTSLNVLRARKRNRLVPSGDMDPLNEAPETTPTGRNISAVRRATVVEQVARAVDTLPDIYREVIVLRYWENLNLQQIGDRLGIPEGTVKSRLSRADDQLHDKLRKMWSEEPQR